MTAMARRPGRTIRLAPRSVVQRHSSSRQREIVLAWFGWIIQWSRGTARPLPSASADRAGRSMVIVQIPFHRKCWEVTTYVAPLLPCIEPGIEAWEEQRRHRWTTGGARRANPHGKNGLQTRRKAPADPML